MTMGRTYLDMRYEIYRNLHNGKLSIRCLKTRKVVGHCDELWMTDVAFHVNQNGVARIRERQQKEVVATVRGKITKLSGFISRLGRTVKTQPDTDCFKMDRPVYFNPYKVETFVTHAGPIRSAARFYGNSSGTMFAI